MTIALQALSLVEKAEPVQVRFTLRLRDQGSMWMQDVCKVYMNYIMFCGHLDYFQKPPLRGRPNTKLEDYALQMIKTVDLFYFIMCENSHG